MIGFPFFNVFIAIKARANGDIYSAAVYEFFQVKLVMEIEPSGSQFGLLSY